MIIKVLPFQKAIGLTALQDRSNRLLKSKLFQKTEKKYKPSNPF